MALPASAAPQQSGLLRRAPSSSSSAAGRQSSTPLGPTSGPNARAVKGSVSDLADLDRLYAAVKAERGTLDIVFANCRSGKPASARQDHRRAH